MVSGVVYIDVGLELYHCVVVTIAGGKKIAMIFRTTDTHTF